MNRDDMAAIRALAERREADYVAHHESCADCPQCPRRRVRPCAGAVPGMRGRPGDGR
jgi:hypothetical protein